MDYNSIRNIIKLLSQKSSFDDAYNELSETIFAISTQECASIIVEIGTIPEDIAIDYKEEKLYTKASELFLSKTFQCLGLKSEVITKRSNCADVIAKSPFHNYSLVADAKTFRLSRTAKNQKDFKVSSLSEWRGDSDYAVLVCPFFQYPRSTSQIYKQALDRNVCLLSWEFMSFLLQNSIKESPFFSLSSIWNISNVIAGNTVVANSKQCFFPKQNNILIELLKQFRLEDFGSFLMPIKDNLKKRGESEILYWNVQADRINNYSKQQAIDELLYKIGLNKKIVSIRKFLESLR